MYQHNKPVETRIEARDDDYEQHEDGEHLVKKALHDAGIGVWHGVVDATRGLRTFVIPARLPLQLCGHQQHRCQGRAPFVRLSVGHRRGRLERGGRWHLDGVDRRRARLVAAVKAPTPRRPAAQPDHD